MLPHPNLRYAEPTVTGAITEGQLPTLAEAKVHLRVDFNDDDSYISGILAATQSYIEDYLGLKFGTSIVNYAYWDYAYPLVHIHFNGAILTTATVPKMEVLQDDGSYADMSADDYEVDYIQSPIRVHMKGGFSTDELNRYRLRFDTANTTVPEFVKQAAFMIIGHYYENRQDVGKERIFEVPMNSKFLLDRYRKQVFT